MHGERTYQSRHAPQTSNVFEDHVSLPLQTKIVADPSQAEGSREDEVEDSDSDADADGETEDSEEDDDFVTAYLTVN